MCEGPGEVTHVPPSAHTPLLCALKGTPHLTGGLTRRFLETPPSSGPGILRNFFFFSIKINAFKCHLLQKNLSTLLYTMETAIPDECAALKFGLALPRDNVGCNLYNSLYIYAI